MTAAYLILWGATALAVPDPSLPVVDDDVDWERADTEIVELLQEYLRVDTVNPPGNETRGAEFLADRLSAAGVPWQIFEESPGRGNLIARLPGSTDAPPICLLSHLDVVTADGEHWPDDAQPLSGALIDGVLWGRGALDMKGMGALEAQTLMMLARHHVPLERDVVLLAVSDEELDNTGMRYVVEQHWDELGCGYVINEGGLGLHDLLFDGQTVFPISIGEKGILWLRMVATGHAGHGSTPLPEQPPELLRAALDRIETRKVSPNWHPSLLELLDGLGQDKGGFTGFVLQRPFLVRTLVKGTLMGNPLTRASLTTTVNVTGLGGAQAPNVVGSESWAHLDCRLQPGVTDADVIAELTELVDDERVRFETLLYYPAAVSEWKGDPVYRALAARTEEEFPGVVTGPVLSVGFTDSIFARQQGARAYGLIPFAVTAEEASTMHGDGERVSVDNLHHGLRVLYRTVVDVAGAPGAPDGVWVDPGEVPPSPFMVAPTVVEEELPGEVPEAEVPETP